MEKDAFYFPHFSNARNDRKLRRVRKELGMEGYGIYFAVLEVLRDQKGFKYPLEDIDLLSDELNTSEPKVKAVICNYDLFQTSDENFFSIRFNEYLSPYLDAKERKRIAGMKGNLVRHKHITKEQAAEMTDQQVIDLTESIRNARNARALPLPKGTTASQKKGKETKTKQSKSNNIGAVASCVLLQDSEVKSSWDEWMKVRDSKKASKSEQAMVRSVNSLMELSGGDKNKAIKILNKSSDRGWTGLFELKQGYSQQSMFDNQDDQTVQINGGNYKIG